MEEKFERFHKFCTWRLTRTSVSKTMIKHTIETKSFKLCRSAQCALCEKTFTTFALRLCAACRNVRYCSKVCQHKDWKRHQLGCKLSRQVSKTTTASLILPVITVCTYNSETWEDLQNTIEYLIRSKHIHPNYIFIETEMMVKDLQKKQNRCSFHFKDHFLHYLLGHKASTRTINFLKFLCDLGFSPNPKSYLDPHYFDPSVFTILHQMDDLIFQPGDYWNTYEIANGYIAFFSWIQNKTFQFPFDQFFDSDNLLALIKHSNESLDSSRALSWMIRFKGKYMLKFLFTAGNHSIKDELDFKSGWEKIETYVKSETRQRQEILRSELMLCLLYIFDLALLCESYLPECWDGYSQ